MPILAVYIVPHGTLIFEPNDELSHSLNMAMRKFAEEVKQLNPDLIFLSTPHGIANTHDFCIYLGDEASGSAEWNDDFTNYKANVKMDMELNMEFINHLGVNNSVSGISYFGGARPFDLGWGEVVPLWFLSEVFGDNMPPVTILSQPARRYTEAVEMVTELKRLGKNIDRMFDKLNRKVVIIVSGDLAHTHLENGPYGFSEDAEKFDQAFENWVKGDREGFFKMIEKTNTALSCGFTGFIMTQGILDNKPTFHPEILSISHPTYFGMAVVKFQFS